MNLSRQVFLLVLQPLGGPFVKRSGYLKICGNLKEVALAPTPVKSKTRRRIPVEKSGGGV